MGSAVPPDSSGYVAAAYGIAAAVVGGYAARLFVRARRARARVAAIAGRRRGER